IGSPASGGCAQCSNVRRCVRRDGSIANGRKPQHHGASAWSGGAPGDGSGTLELITNGFGSVEMILRSVNPTWSRIARQQALLNSQKTVGSNSSWFLPDIIPCG